MACFWICQLFGMVLFCLFRSLYRCCAGLPSDNRWHPAFQFHTSFYFPQRLTGQARFAALKRAAQHIPTTTADGPQPESLRTIYHTMALPPHRLRGWGTSSWSRPSPAWGAPWRGLSMYAFSNMPFWTLQEQLRACISDVTRIIRTGAIFSVDSV